MVTVGVSRGVTVIVQGGNGGDCPLPIPFLTLALMEKGSQDGVANTSANLEIGDLVQGFKDANTVWKSAIYNGGDPTDRENYTPLIEVVLQEPVHYSAAHYSSEHYSTN